LPTPALPPAAHLIVLVWCVGGEDLIGPSMSTRARGGVHRIYCHAARGLAKTSGTFMADGRARFHILRAARLCLQREAPLLRGNYLLHQPGSWGTASTAYTREGSNPVSANAVTLTNANVASALATTRAPATTQKNIDRFRAWPPLVLNVALLTLLLWLHLWMLPLMLPQTWLHLGYNVRRASPRCRGLRTSPGPRRTCSSSTQP
jgi:hypothetical protein